MTRIAILATIAALAAAGCIQAPDPAGEIADQARVPAQGTMTATEDVQESAALCTDGIDLSSGRFCATRVVTVDGTIAGIPRLDVDLETFNGDVDVLSGADGRWGFVATLKARGASQEEALANLDLIAFAWEHQDATGHFLEVVADHEGNSGEARLSAEIAATLPRSLIATLTAQSSNGDVTLQDMRTDGAALTTSNGDIEATGDVTQVAFTTSNGDIDATLTPRALGRWTITTSNGEVTLDVPERSDLGYTIEGTTSNGEVDIQLQDGEKGDCPQGSQYYTPPCNHRTFESSRYASRAIRVTAQLTSSNGDITIGPS